MTCRAAVGITYHVPHFVEPAPPGTGICAGCRKPVTIREWASESCPGPPVEDWRRPQPDDPACAFCGDPLHVDPGPRVFVQLFGSICNTCAAVAEIA